MIVYLCEGVYGEFADQKPDMRWDLYILSKRGSSSLNILE